MEGTFGADGPARRRDRAQPLHGHGGGPGRGRHAARDTYVDLGRGEFHAGRSLDALLAAYRVGARLAWRRFVEAGSAGGLAPDVLYSVGEAMFAYIDEISAESADGYAEEQSAAAGESQRRRRRLVRLLAQDPPPGQEAIRTAAQAAGWQLPRTLGARSVPARRRRRGRRRRGRRRRARSGEPVAGEEIVEAIATRLARRLGSGAVGGAAGGLGCVFVPDPDAPGRRRQIVAELDHEGGRDIVGVGRRSRGTTPPPACVAPPPRSGSPPPAASRAGS